MIVTIVSFVSLTCELTAAGIAGSMWSDINVLQTLKDKDRCSFINGNWSSYCECKMNTYDQTTRKVARITGRYPKLYLHFKIRDPYKSQYRPKTVESFSRKCELF